MTVTAQIIADATFEYSAHLNMGRDGYGYEFRCCAYPRLRFVDRVYRPSRAEPDGKRTREWYVDGEPVADLAAAVEALRKPPVLTPDEQRVLELVPYEFEPHRKVWDDIAGVPHPEGAIMPNTPHSRALKWLSALVRKGMIEHGTAPSGRDYPSFVPQHLRSVPTIRRRPAQ